MTLRRHLRPLRDEGHDGVEATSAPTWPTAIASAWIWSRTVTWTSSTSWLASGRATRASNEREAGGQAAGLEPGDDPIDGDAFVERGIVEVGVRGIARVVERGLQLGFVEPHTMR